MPSLKKIEELASAAAVRGNVPPVRTPAPGDEMPPEYWEAVLDDPPTQRLAEIRQHVLRVGCRRLRAHRRDPERPTPSGSPASQAI